MSKLADGRIENSRTRRRCAAGVAYRKKNSPLAIYPNAHAPRLAAIALESEAIYADAVAAVEGEPCGLVADHAPSLDLVRIESV